MIEWKRTKSNVDQKKIQNGDDLVGARLFIGCRLEAKRTNKQKKEHEKKTKTKRHTTRQKENKGKSTQNAKKIKKANLMDWCRGKVGLASIKASFFFVLLHFVFFYFDVTEFSYFFFVFFLNFSY